MRPPVPVPATRLKSIPCSLAMRRASGEERSTCGAADPWTDVCGTCAVRSLRDWGLWNLYSRSSRCHRSPNLADHRDDRIHLDRSAFGKADLSQHAGNRRGNLGVHLVGRDLKERLVDCDGVADLLEPFGDRALEDRFAHLGHDDFRWHASLFRASACTGSCRIINRGRPSVALISAGPPPQATKTACQ